MNEALLFLTCLMIGAILRVVYVLERTLAKHTDLIPITLILDFLFAALFVTILFGVMYFLSNGVFRAYLAIGMLAGFLLLTIFISSPAVPLKPRKKPPPTQKTKKSPQSQPKPKQIKKTKKLRSKV